MCSRRYRPPTFSTRKLTALPRKSPARRTASRRSARRSRSPSSEAPCRVRAFDQRAASSTWRRVQRAVPQLVRSAGHEVQLELDADTACKPKHMHQGASSSSVVYRRIPPAPTTVVACTSAQRACDARRARVVRAHRRRAAQRRAADGQRGIYTRREQRSLRRTPHAQPPAAQHPGVANVLSAKHDVQRPVFVRRPAGMQAAAHVVRADESVPRPPPQCAGTTCGRTAWCEQTSGRRT